MVLVNNELYAIKEGDMTVIKYTDFTSTENLKIAFLQTLSYSSVSNFALCYVAGNIVLTGGLRFS